MDAKLLISCLAVFLEAIDLHMAMESRETVVLTAHSVELDCIANTSRPLRWYFKRYGSKDVELIVANDQKHPNVSDVYSIVLKDNGNVALLIDHVFPSLAGTYECFRRDEEYKLFVEVIVLDPTPSCDEGFSSKTMVCSFTYAGNVAPQLELLTPGSIVLSMSCNASNGTVDCTFETNPSSNAIHLIHHSPPVFKIYSVDNSTCKWVTDKASSNAGTLQTKGSGRTIGGWQCNSTGFRPTTRSTSTSLTEILLPSCAGVASMLLALLLLGLHKKYHIFLRKRIQPNVSSGTAIGSVDTMSIYDLAISGVTEFRQTSFNPSFENSLYGFAESSLEGKPVVKVPTNQIETDEDFIYPQMRPIPEEEGHSQMTRTIPRDGFNTSTFASIDHTLTVPPLLS